MEHKSIIIALDKLTQEEIFPLLNNFSNEIDEVKAKIILKINDLMALVGMKGIYELFQNSGFQLMLDPKWNDIPNTIENYFLQLHTSGLGDITELVTIHTSGGKTMIEAAVRKRNELGLKTKILCITSLTSLDDTDTQMIFDEMTQYAVLKLAKIALDAGADGLVCSPLEAQVLRSVYGDNFLIVTPGVRFEGKAVGDQKRVTTPGEAIQNGADHIVMGRDILGSTDISQALERYFTETTPAHFTPTGDFSFEKTLYRGSWEDILKYIGAIYIRPENGKYCRLTSGLLSNTYVNIGAVERNYLVVEKAMYELAQKLKTSNISADVVLGAQMGSIRLSLSLAEKMGIQESVYTEKTGVGDKEMALKRHDINLVGKKVILSEDIITKGSTLEKMIDIVQQGGGEVVGITCIGNRYGSNVFNGIPLISCFTPAAFELYYDDTTFTSLRANMLALQKTEAEINAEISNYKEKYQALPNNGIISEKPKNEWNTLIASMYL